MLCLDASYPGVDVPSRFRKDHSLRLILNKNMPHPIIIDDKSIRSELRFGGIPHYCIIPLDAIWSTFNPDSNRGMMWPESMPEDVWKHHRDLSINDIKPLPDRPKKSTKPAVKTTPFQVIEGGVSNKNTNTNKSLKPKLTIVE